jgi:hypothetical protein
VPDSTLGACASFRGIASKRPLRVVGVLQFIGLLQIIVPQADQLQFRDRVRCHSRQGVKALCAGRQLVGDCHLVSPYQNGTGVLPMAAQYENLFGRRPSDIARYHLRFC